MKKLFLTLSSVLLAGAAANAEVTLTFADATDIVGTYFEADSNSGEHYQPVESFKIGDFSFTAAKGENATSDPAYYTGSNATLRVYLDNSFTISNAAVDMKTIEFECKSMKGVSAENPIVANVGGQITYNGSKFTWTRPETDVVINEITFTTPATKVGSSNPNVQIKKAVVTVLGEENPPVDPDPDMAVAHSIAEVYSIGADDSTLPIKADFEMTVTYVNGINVYVTDGTTASLIYGSTPYVKGNKIAAGMVVNYAPYAQLPELKPVADYDLPSVAGNVEVVYPELQLSAITDADLNRIVMIPSVTFDNDTPSGRSNFQGYNGETVVTFRNNFVVESQPAGTYDVTAAVSAYNGTIQVLPIEYRSTGGTVTPPETNVSIYSGLVDNADDWTFDNVQVPEDSYVWSWSGSYGLKGTGYFGGARHNTKAWAISPVINLADYENVSLNFEQAANFYGDQETFVAMSTMWIREADGEWEDLNVEVLPEGNSWTYTNTGDINLSAYDGKTIQVGFYYTSSEEKAGTWEIKNFFVKGDKSTGVSEIVETETPAEYYNLQGVRVANPSNGIYIVRKGNQVSKVVVK